LNNINLKSTTENLIDTFLEAGEVAKELSNKGVKIEIKADKSPVTNADLAVDEILQKKVAKLTPYIPIISEETINMNLSNKFKNFWLIDPIDGTRDYIKGKDEYTLNAALIIDLKPAAGIIYAPAKKRLFFSYGKNFAYEINDGKTIELKCHKKNKGKIIGLENSGNTPNEVLEIYRKYKVTEKIKMSSSFKFCILAAGEADIYAASARAFEWDIAAGHAILIHAGGFMTTHNGEEILYGKEKYKNIPLIAKRSMSLEK